MGGLAIFKRSCWISRSKALHLTLLLTSIVLGMTAAPALCQNSTSLSRPEAGGAPTTVRVGFYLADLFEISASDQTFLADVVVRAEWLDPRLVGRWSDVHRADLNDVWNPNLQLLNQRGATASLPQRVDVDPSGWVRWQQRWIGRFSARMDLRNFPLDRQRLHIQLVSLGHASNEVELIVNSENVKSGRATDLSVTEWAVGPAIADIANFEPAPGTKVLAGAQLWWEARRHIGYQAVQVIFPLILIVFMGWAAFWVDPSIVGARISVAMTTMLTIIAYRFALGRSVPNLTYLTRFDYFMLASTFLTFLALVLVAVGAYFAAKERLTLVRDIDKWARFAFPAVFGLAFVLAWWA